MHREKVQYVTIIYKHFIRSVNNKTDIYQDRAANAHIKYRTISLISCIAIFYRFRFKPGETINVSWLNVIDSTFPLADTCFVVPIRVVFKGRKRKRYPPKTVTHRSIFCGDIDIDNSHYIYADPKVYYG